MSEDPAGGRDTWTIAEADWRRDLWDMACPSTTLCVAVDDAGNVVTSHDPTAGAWSVRHVSERPLRHVECPTTSFCIASDDETGSVFTSSDATTWTKIPIGHVLESLSCPTASLCVATTFPSTVVVSTDPAGGTAAWHGTYLGDLAASALGVTCASPALCIASGGDWHGGVFVTESPASGPWTFAGFEGMGTNALLAADCPSATRCFATDDAGRVLSSSDPTGDRHAWTPLDIGAGALGAISCPTTALCVAGDEDGNVYRSSDGWSAAQIAGGAAITGIDCPTASYCVALDDAGAVHTSAPAGWTSAAIDAGHALTAVSCASETFCMVVDDAGGSFRSLGELGAGVSLGYPYSTARPQVTGTALPGQVMTCSPGTWTGSPSFTYQWRRADNDITGATGPQYTVGADDYGWPLSCTVTAANDAGKAVGSSSPWAPVVPALIVTRAPQITGTATVGYAVRCDGAAFQGAGAVNITAYAWYRDGARIDWPAQYSHYILTSADSGHELTCSATATNATTSLTATSAAVRVDGRVVIADRPSLSAKVKATAVRRAELLRRGLPVTVTCSQRCVVTLQVRLDAKTAKALHAPRTAGRATTTIAAAGAKTVRVRLPGAFKRRIAKARRIGLEIGASERTAGRLPGAKVTVRR